MKKSAYDMEQEWRRGVTVPNSASPDKKQDSTPSSAKREPASPEGAEESQEQLPADDPQVVYMGPESGPFECENCLFFVADGQPCKKVADPVSSEGCCNLFASAHNETVDEEHQEGMQQQQAAPAPPSAAKVM